MKELIQNQVYELQTKSGITQEVLAEATGVGNEGGIRTNGSAVYSNYQR